MCMSQARRPPLSERKCEIRGGSSPSSQIDRKIVGASAAWGHARICLHERPGSWAAWLAATAKPIAGGNVEELTLARERVGLDQIRGRSGSDIIDTCLCLVSFK